MCVRRVGVVRVVRMVAVRIVAVRAVTVRAVTVTSTGTLQAAREWLFSGDLRNARRDKRCEDGRHEPRTHGCRSRVLRARARSVALRIPRFPTLLPSVRLLACLLA